MILRSGLDSRAHSLHMPILQKAPWQELLLMTSLVGRELPYGGLKTHLVSTAFVECAQSLFLGFCAGMLLIGGFSCLKLMEEQSFGSRISSFL